MRNGTSLVTVSAHRNETEIRTMMLKCTQLMKDVERFLHGGVADSDTQRLSMCGHFSPLTVHPWTYRALQTIVECCQVSQGCSDITYTPRDSLRKSRNHQHSIHEWHAADGWDDFVFMRGNQIMLKRPMRVELMDLVQAYCVDKACEHLEIQRNVISATVQYGEYRREILISEEREAHAESTFPRPALCLRPAYFFRTLSGLMPVSKIQHPLTGKNQGAQKSLSVYAPSCLKAGLLSRTVLLAPQEMWGRLLTSYNAMALFISRRDEMILFPSPVA
jgi:FAD:protein FMN transferase